MLSFNNFFPYLISPRMCFLLWNKNHSCQRRFLSLSERDHEGPILQADSLKNLPGLRQNWKLGKNWDFNTTHGGGALAPVTEWPRIATAHWGPPVASHSALTFMRTSFYDLHFTDYYHFTDDETEVQRGDMANKESPATFKNVEEDDKNGPHLIPHVIFHQLLAPTNQKVYVTTPGVAHGKSSRHVSCIY